MLLRHNRLFFHLLPIAAGLLIAVELILVRDQPWRWIIAILIIITTISAMTLLRGYAWAKEDNELQ